MHNLLLLFAHYDRALWCSQHCRTTTLSKSTEDCFVSSDRWNIVNVQEGVL